MGKLYEFAKGKCTNDSLKIRPFWAPDFCVYGEPREQAQGQAILVASLNADNEVVWNDECRNVLGISASEAKELFAAYRRP